MSHQIRLAANGPLLVEGDLEIVGADGESRRATRVALCRCGQSSRKPFCDGTHKSCGYAAGGAVGQAKALEAPEGLGHLRIAVKPNASVRIEGPFVLTDAAGEVRHQSGANSFCRCGQSANPPFCDGAHKACGFTDPGLLPPG